MIFRNSDPASPKGAAAPASTPSPAKGVAGSAAAPSSPPPAATTTQRGQAASIRYVDRPEIAETFADSISGVTFDGQTLRIEFAVTRLDEIKPNTQLSGRRYPACRMVLPPAAAIDLINRMQQIAAALTQAGVVRQSQPTMPGTT